jgi:tartronate-semialdehyde synthase
MDYCVQLGFDNINTPADVPERSYGVDHVKVVEGLGCKAIRVHTPDELRPAIAQAEAWMKEFQVPVVVEVMLERVTNVAMGTEIDKIVEFEGLAESRADAPTSIAALLD